MLWNLLLGICWPLIVCYAPFFGTLRARMGIGLPDWRDAAAPSSRTSPGASSSAAPLKRVLINAVSAGEVVAIAPLIRELLRRQPNLRIALTTTTRSGQERALKDLGDCVALIAYFPLLDLPWNVRRYLGALKPQLYITTEAELWPNIMTQCRRRGIPVVLVNARIYMHNKRGLRGWVMRKLYKLCDLIVCQDAGQRENFLRFGIAAIKLAVSGNTKFDFELPEWEPERLAAEGVRFGLDESTPLVVAGSTHEGEEQPLLDALAALRNQHPRLRLVLAPRHVERADGVRALALKAGFAALKLAGHQPGAAWDVLIVDRYGVLVDCYRLAQIVVLGGTFHPKVGGHNILEATALGKAVFCGPYTYSITAQMELLRSAGAVCEIASAEDLTSALAELLADPEQARRIGQAALEATLANRGAAARAAEFVLALQIPPEAGI